MLCPNCETKLSKVMVGVEGARSKVISYQCPKCDHFEFEEESSKKVVNELRETPLTIKQKIIKLSHNRLGMYFNKDVIRSLNLKAGKDVYVSVPDKKHIVLDIKNK